jgi:ribosome-associated protein
MDGSWGAVCPATTLAMWSACWARNRTTSNRVWASTAGTKSFIGTIWWCYKAAQWRIPDDTEEEEALATKRKLTRSAVKRPVKASPRRKGEQEAEDRTRSIAMAIAGVGLEYKALNVEIIDVRGKVDYSDYVVVMSGRSDRQVNALGKHIEEELQKQLQARCLGVEGMPSGTWLLMDYGDVIVHIFHEDTRGYYDLETLWLDAARVATGSSAQ